VGLKDSWLKIVGDLRKLRRSRDPQSYAHYERDRDLERRDAERARQAQTAAAERTQEDQQRQQSFEERYDADHRPSESTGADEAE